MLVDRAEVTVSAGQGGDGVVSWRREKAVARGGPDGGDGGRGGDVRFLTTDNRADLAGFRHRHLLTAEDGERGANKKKHGRTGADLTLLLPVGTEITAVDGTKLADLATPNQLFIAGRGGAGGKGNWHFANSRQQSPQIATKGQPGESRKIILQLKLIGDFAVVGLPNAGKSSLVSALTGVGLPIGPYQFSTREPFPVVYNQSGDRAGDRLILIDLPGLIEGAHRGRGLGDQFLKHTDRVKGLILVADASVQPEESLATTANELRLYRAELADKARIVVLSKIDLISAVTRRDLTARFPEAILVSSQTGAGLERLKSRLLANR